jgi:hypothetical protein
MRSWRNREGIRRDRHIVGSIVLTLLASAAVTPCQSQAQVLRGLLLETGTDRPIDLGEMALVSEEGDTVAAALTDADGYFSLEAPEPGTYRVIGTALGYLGRAEGPFELAEGDLQVVQVVLSPAPIPIEGVDVASSPIIVSDDVLVANGFYERLLQGRGQFLTPELIEASGARLTPLLFRELKHVRPQYGASPWKTWVQLWSPAGPGACRPRVFVDDVWIDKPGFQQYAAGLGLADVVPKDEIRAIELYWGHQAPIRYSAPDGLAGQETCGVILIWTRSPR